MDEFPCLGEIIGSARMSQALFPDTGMGVACSLLAALFDVFWVFDKRLRCVCAKEYGSEKDMVDSKSLFFKRSADEILSSGLLSGAGCTDICVVYAAAAKELDLDVKNAYITAEAISQFPHTLLSLQISDSEVVLDPKWMMHPGYKALAERDNVFEKEYNVWFAAGLPSGVDEVGRKYFKKPTVSGQPKKWVVVDVLEPARLSDGSYSRDIRFNRIGEVFV
ncbi:MAG: hypothetical protein KKD39_04435 [Candidatus Altiarchaeota archaeon]|nr:hypothetical protein [Candidatus Altiarchaeota archaeon]